MDSAFRWTREAWGYALRCGPLEGVAQHLFTTRQLVLRPQAAAGSGAPGAASLAAVRDAWTKAVGAIGGEVALLMRVKQVHGRTVRVLKAGISAGEESAARPEADAMVSDQSGLVLAVQVADCVPVLMADKRSGAAAAVHAGWRGTCAGVTSTAVEAMVREFATDPADLVAAIGPSIGSCCYQVGAELLDAFRREGASEDALARWFSRDARGRLRLDLWTANRDQLIQSGVRADAIYLAGLCTQTHANVFDSFRAAGPDAGRMAALVRVPPRG